jgi:hypothetical protein
MRARTALSLSILCFLPLAIACGTAGSDPSPQAVTTTASPLAAEEGRGEDREGPKHIFFIMMENHGTSEILGNTADAPFVNELASRHGVAENYFGVTHPSLPNYLAAFSGDFQGIWDDCAAGPGVTCAPEEFVPSSGDATASLLLTPAEVASATATPHWFAGKNLVDQIEESGRSWRAYMQSIPAAGSTVEYAPVVDTDAGPTTVKLYAQKHDPFMYFSDIRNSPERMAKIVPFDRLEEDLEGRRDRVADFVWISPDQCHDMHGVSPGNAALAGLPSCGYPASGLDHGAIQLGDAFLRDTVTRIVRSRAWDEGAVIAIAWDEDDYSGYAGCCGSPTTTGGAVLGGANAPAIVVRSHHAAHVVSQTPYNHYSLLGTIQRVWGLGCLGRTCGLGDAELMLPLFRH